MQVNLSPQHSVGCASPPLAHFEAHSFEVSPSEEDIVVPPTSTATRSVVMIDNPTAAAAAVERLARLSSPPEVVIPPSPSGTTTAPRTKLALHPTAHNSRNSSSTTVQAFSLFGLVEEFDNTDFPFPRATACKPLAPPPPSSSPPVMASHHHGHPSSQPPQQSSDTPDFDPAGRGVRAPASGGEGGFSLVSLLASKTDCQAALQAGDEELMIEEEGSVNREAASSRNPLMLTQSYPSSTTITTTTSVESQQQRQRHLVTSTLDAEPRADATRGISTPPPPSSAAVAMGGGGGGGFLSASALESSLHFDWLMSIRDDVQRERNAQPAESFSTSVYTLSKNEEGQLEKECMTYVI